jgi:hypothetical protein
MVAQTVEKGTTNLSFGGPGAAFDFRDKFGSFSGKREDAFPSGHAS